MNPSLSVYNPIGPVQEENNVRGRKNRKGMMRTGKEALKAERGEGLSWVRDRNHGYEITVVLCMANKIIWRVGHDRKQDQDRPGTGEME